MATINKQLNTGRWSTRRIATLAVLTAMGLIMFMIESLFPPLFLPGAKMGLSNIFSLLTLVILGPTEAIVVVLIRTTMGSVFTGSMSTLLYSMTAGLVSVIVASILVELVYPRITIIAVSVVSAVIHNLTQNIVFCVVSSTPQMYVYAPWLALLGVVAGLIVGFAVHFIVKGLPYRVLANIVVIEPPHSHTATDTNNPTDTNTSSEVQSADSNAPSEVQPTQPTDSNAPSTDKCNQQEDNNEEHSSN